MKRFLPQLKHETWKLLISPSSYIAAFLFLLVMGFLFQILLVDFASGPQESHPSTLFFRLFFVPVFFMVPLLTMRSVAEERSAGTIETLFTTPVTVAEVVLAKFAAAYAYYLALWLFTATFHLVFKFYAQGDATVDPLPIASGYAYIALSGLLFLSLGILASSLTRSQLVAGILGFTLVFGFIVVGSYLDELMLLLEPRPEWTKALSRYVDSIAHMNDFAKGIVDTRAIVLYLSGCAAALFLSILKLEYQEEAA